MSSVNRDLQASYQILSQLEQSKSRSDVILDRLPGIFCVINEQGVMLKGNYEAARILGLDHESLIGQAFSALFRKETWNIFSTYFNKALERPETAIEFELSLDTRGQDEKPFYWRVSRFEAHVRGGHKLFSIVGVDISELRKTERQLAEIFASIPLGIVTIGRQGCFESKYSAHTEWLLSTAELVNCSFKDKIFLPGWDKLSGPQKQAVDDLKQIFGNTELYFDILKDSLPKEIEFPLTLDGVPHLRYLGLTYKAIVYSGNVERILLVIEDRTQLVNARNLERHSKLLEEQGVARIIQIKTGSPEVLGMVMPEFESLTQSCEEALKGGDLAQIKRAMHGIKGNARVVGFKFLAQVAHDAETLLNAGEQDFRGPVEAVCAEWREMRSLYGALHKDFKEPAESAGPSQEDPDERIKTIRDLFEQFNLMLVKGQTFETALIAERIMLAIASMNYVSLASLEELARVRVEETAKKLGKKARVVFEWDDVHVCQHCKLALSECLLHLLGNAIAHGIESPEERLAQGKPECGTVRIRAHEDLGMLHCEVSDDGAGINVIRVRDLAVKRKLISLDKSLLMTKNKIRRLIFLPGFSTTEEVNEVSGRGVGLDAVVTALGKLGGKIRIRAPKGGGTRFLFNMRVAKDVAIHRICLPLSELMQMLQSSIKVMAEQEHLWIEFRGAAGKQAGLYYGDARRICLAVTTLLGNFADERKIEVSLRVAGGKLQFTASRKALADEPQSRERRPEFKLASATCENYLWQHQGKVLVEGDVMKLSLGQVLTKDSIPALHLGLGEGITHEEAERTLGQIKKIAAELDIPLESELDGPLLLSRRKKLAGKVIGLSLGAARETLWQEILQAVEQAMGIAD